MARVEFRDVVKRFGEVEVIPGLTLTIEDGEFVALLGPSGCGKSTTLFMLAGIYLPSGGELRFDGHLVNEVEARDRNVGIVFQSYALYPHMTVRDNIGFPLRFQKTPRDEAVGRVRAAADLVHVGELLDRRPSELSGGQQQRVALARALVKEPQLLLLDEPLSNLDATLRLTMRTEIKSLQQRLGVTTILVTHDQIEATTMADRIVCMRARPDRAGRHPGRPLPPAGEPVHRQLHRLAAGQPDPRRGRRRRRPRRRRRASRRGRAARAASPRAATRASALRRRRGCPAASPRSSRWAARSSTW